MIELVESETLATRLKKGQLSLRQTAQFGEQIATLWLRPIPKVDAPRSQPGRHHALQVWP